MLYEAHPIIESVGNLSDTTSQKWLVFIQISLQPYSEHKTKLSKLFRSCSGNPDNKSWSLYTHFRNTFEVAYESSTPDLLLYISPQGLQDALLESVQQVRINQTLYVGILEQSSSFYTEMIEFEEMRN